MVFYGSIDLLQGQYFLMNNLNQSYESTNKMPIYEFDLFMDMKSDELKEEQKRQQKKQG